MDIQKLKRINNHIRQTAANFDCPYECIESPQTVELFKEIGIDLRVSPEDQGSNRDYATVLVNSFYPVWVNTRYPENNGRELLSTDQAHKLANAYTRRNGVDEHTAKNVYQILAIGERYGRWEIEDPMLSTLRYWENNFSEQNEIFSESIQQVYASAGCGL